MDLKSIRWQLPLSYAAIALLATAALGAALLFQLNGYYGGLEQDFLKNNALAVQQSLKPLAIDQLNAEMLQAQVKSLAIFSNSRIRLYDRGGGLLADSGDPAAQSDRIGYFSLPAQALPVTSAAPVGDVIIMAGSAGLTETGVTATTTEGPITLQINAENPKITSGFFIATAPTEQSGQVQTTLWQSPLTFYSVVNSITAVAPQSGSSTAERSSQSIELPLTNPAGETSGQIVLSEGPAYGRQIVASAAQAWAIAGVLAVLLAAAAGWVASRRVSRPLVALTQAAGQMTAGDLATRTPTADLPAREFSLLAASFNEMAERIEETILALRRFASDATHELKTPLTALRTNLDLLGDEPDEDRRSTYLLRAQEQVRDLDELMTGLLDLSRLEAGNRSEPFVPVDLHEMLARLAEIYAAQAEQAGLEFMLDLETGPVLITGNPGQLEQAIANLLENAIKFTPPGGQVRLGLAVEGNQARLWVEDSGIGIPPEDLALLFNRFHRGRNTASYPGSGLGLAIVQAIVEGHSGSVEAANRPEGGARFSVSLKTMV